jgi:lysophospholipid acyltransferase (LPLAT)-like uncharacterized protein
MSFVKTVIRVRGWITSRLLMFQQWSWRLEVEGYEELKRMIQNGDRVIVCFWHGKYVPLLPMLRGTDGCVFTCADRSGDIIAEIAGDLGFRCTQIPHHGGHRSLELMEHALSEVNLAGIAVDGPLGPYHQVKHGVIRLASRTGSYLLPISVNARNKWIIQNRWDRMEIPFPFTKIRLVMGKPMAVPASVDQKHIAIFSLKLRQAIDRAQAKAAGLAGEFRGARQFQW